MKRVGMTLVFAVLLSACAGGDSETGAEVGNVKEKATSHAKAVKSCDEKKAKTIKSAKDEAGRVQAVMDWGICVGKANDDVVSKLKKGLTGSQASLGKDIPGIYDAYRSINELCGIVVFASDAATTEKAQFVAAYCYAQREGDLATLIDTYANLGGTRLQPADGRKEYPDCYAARDDGDSEGGGEELAEHEVELAQCIAETGLAAEGEEGIVTRVLQNFPKLPEDTVAERLSISLKGAQESAAKVCSIVIDRSEDKDKNGALEAGCNVTATLELAALFD